MKIIILGAGQVGLSMAEVLAGEDNDITLVDNRPEQLQLAQDMDIQTVLGNGSYPEVLARAGGEDAELLLAVTDRDEVNMVACQIARTLFSTPTKIARIRAGDYLVNKAVFGDHAVPVDVIISPEQIVARQVQQLIEHPGALQVLDFAGGKIRLVAVRAVKGGPLVEHKLRELKQHMPAVNTRVAAIYREHSEDPIIPGGDTEIAPGDEVFFVAAERHIRVMTRELRQVDRRAGAHVMIAGAGNIGLQLACALEQGNYHVKLIEQNAGRAAKVAELVDRTMVLHGEAADEELLRRENIGAMNVFCALTNNDEANIMSSMLARRLNARRVVTLVNRPAYVDLMENSVIDTAISPRMATVGSLLTHIRRGHVVAVHSLRRGIAEAIEIVAHGSPDASKVVGRRIGQIPLPPQTTISAILHGDEVRMAHDDTVIEADDHVILFTANKKHLPHIERLFQVDPTFV